MRKPLPVSLAMGFRVADRAGANKVYGSARGDRALRRLRITDIMIKKLLTLSAAMALTLSVCGAQTSSTTSSTTTNDLTGASKTTTTTTENTGTISDYTAGSSLVLSTGSGEPVHYKFGKTVTYVTPDGKVIESSRVKKSSKVRVHYVKEGDDMLVDKVVVLDND